jgi:small subunit ribosomal protein S16
MLAIRMQRIGRRGHAQFRVIVQDSRFSPKSGRVVAYLGTYDPHTKKLSVDNEKASGYLTNGARPSDQVARLLQKEGVKLPDWVKLEGEKKRQVRQPDKLRRNRPPVELPADSTGQAAEAKESAPPAAEETAPEATDEAPTEAPAEEASVSEESVEEVTPEETPAAPAKPKKEAAESEPEQPPEGPADAEKAS